MENGTITRIASVAASENALGCVTFWVPEHTCESCFVLTAFPFASQVSNPSPSPSSSSSSFSFSFSSAATAVEAQQDQHTDLERDTTSAKHKLEKMTAEEKEKTVKAPSYDKTTKASERKQPAAAETLRAAEQLPQIQALEARRAQTLQYTLFPVWEWVSNAPEQTRTLHQPRPRSPTSPSSRYRYLSPTDCQLFDPPS
jgi:hypothetical protein